VGRRGHARGKGPTLWWGGLTANSADIYFLGPHRRGVASGDSSLFSNQFGKKKKGTICSIRASGHWEPTTRSSWPIRAPRGGSGNVVFYAKHGGREDRPVFRSQFRRFSTALESGGGGHGLDPSQIFGKATGQEMLMKKTAPRSPNGQGNYLCAQGLSPGRMTSESTSVFRTKRGWG